MLFLYLVLSLDKTIEGINSILPIVSYRNSKVNIFIEINLPVKVHLQVPYPSNFNVSMVTMDRMKQS